jgi:hypothetical protein
MAKFQFCAATNEGPLRRQMNEGLLTFIPQKKRLSASSNFGFVTRVDERKTASGLRRQIGDGQLPRQRDHTAIAPSHSEGVGESFWVESLFHPYRPSTIPQKFRSSADTAHAGSLI